MLHKWIIPIVLLIGFIVVFVSCRKDLRDDVDDLLDRVSKLEMMCEQINSDIAGLKQIVSVLEANDYITSVNELADKSGYAINFLKGNTIVIKHGTDGDCPVIGVEEFEDIFYWTQKIGDNSPSWILDSEGNKVQATGMNGTTPVIGVNKNGNWTVDYGEGIQEIKVNGKPVPARGKDGLDGYSPFRSVTDQGDYVEIKLTTGTVLKLQKWEEKRMRIVFDVNAENLISDVVYLNEDRRIPYYVENPDPQASVYFEATNGWIVEHIPNEQSILLKPFAASNEDGCIIASVMRDNRLISQFRFFVKTTLICQPLKAENITANPEELEAIGGKVPVTINITFEKRWFNKDAVVVVTPYLYYQGEKSLGNSYTYRGENIEGNDWQMVSYEDGGRETLKSSFDYKSEMLNNSKLYLNFDITIHGRKLTVPDVEIASGVITTGIVE